MKRPFSSLLLAWLLLLNLPVAVAATAPEALAARLLVHLDAGQYAQAEALFSTEMAAAVPAAKLAQIWESLPSQLGAAQGRGPTSVGPQQGLQVVVVPLQYANGRLLARIAIDTQGRIAGFLIQPAPPAPAAAPAANASYQEREFPVAGLPGTLALPRSANAAKPVPAVVLVHGSGPHDRDQRVGPNRPFLDLARGLAAQDIAVLRYEKRSKARPQDFAGRKFSVDDETTDDAVAAVAALGSVAGIDPQRLFVLGHSQGGMLAPRIAARSGQAAGLILLAAPARPLLTLLPEQNRYLLGADGQIDPQEQQFLDQLQSKISQVRGAGEIADHDSPLGLPAHYWRSFDPIDPVADARASRLPLLLLQGGRDFQVSDTDWQLWTQALGEQSRARLLHYPRLNHLGIAGSGPGSLAEYQQPGQVDRQLIDDVANWIKQH